MFSVSGTKFVYSPSWNFTQRRFPLRNRAQTKTHHSYASCKVSHKRTATPEICHAPSETVLDVDDGSIDLSRRKLSATLLLGLLPTFQSGPSVADPITDAKPVITPPGKLTSSEEAIIRVFEDNTVSVVNVFDITLIGRAPQATDTETPEGNGTGIIWDKDGHVVTNYHVLGNVLKGLGDGAAGKRVAKISVLGADGYQQSYDGVLVGSDRQRDLAVVRVNAPKEMLKPAALGSSAGLHVGQLCLAIGNPFGFDHTLTTGAISGLGRDIQSQAGVTIGGGIQTDAAINPGNSGGPLLDSAGRVIGINTAIFTNSGTSAGVGFAIPIDSVKRAVPQIIELGRVVQPSLKLQVASERVAQSLQVKGGALIQSVEPDGPAARAGLLPTRRTLQGIVAGDVIVEMNGKPVKTSGDLSTVLDELSVGEEVEVKALREGQPMSFRVKLDSA